MDEHQQAFNGIDNVQPMRRQAAAVRHNDPPSATSSIAPIPTRGLAVSAICGGSSFLAHAATWPSLPLRSATASEQQPTSARALPLRWPLVRASNSLVDCVTPAGT